MEKGASTSIKDERNNLDKHNEPIFVKPKGYGFLRGIELSEKVAVGDFSTEARKKGLLLVGAAENTIRILPPLNTSFEEIDLAFLKLKEISYIHASAYHSGELKHGPLALVDRRMPVVCFLPDNHLARLVLSNLAEVEARQGQTYIFTNKKIAKNKKQVKVIKMPDCPDLIVPILYIIPAQLLSYHVAIKKKTDVDKPRNLAKSVTVE